MTFLHAGQIFHSVPGNLRLYHHRTPGRMYFCSVACHLWQPISRSHLLYGGRSFLCRGSVSCSGSHHAVPAPGMNLSIWQELLHEAISPDFQLDADVRAPDMPGSMQAPRHAEQGAAVRARVRSAPGMRLERGPARSARLGSGRSQTGRRRRRARHPAHRHGSGGAPSRAVPVPCQNIPHLLRGRD